MKNSMAILAAALMCSAASSQADTTGVRVKIQTTSGDIIVELDSVKAPKTVENFLGYVKDGFYEGTTFHRVIKTFMIQGGGMDADMQKKKTKDPVQNEADNGLKNKRGTIAMARTNDPHSATSQFFINVVDNDMLDHTGKTPQGWGYCVFGKVVEGMKVVDAIRDTPTTTKGFYKDVPVKPIFISKASVVQKEK